MLRDRFPFDVHGPNWSSMSPEETRRTRFMASSFIDAPLNRLDAKWNVVRVAHVIAWIGSILSISMVLDV
jgi:hypothetical protein